MAPKMYASSFTLYVWMPIASAASSSSRTKRLGPTQPRPSESRRSENERGNHQHGDVVEQRWLLWVEVAYLQQPGDTENTGRSAGDAQVVGGDARYLPKTQRDDCQ